MNNSQQVLLTLDEIEGWEQEAEELARDIAEDQARLDALRQKLKAAEFFRPAATAALKRASIFGKRAEISNGDSNEPDSDNLVAAIEKIANNAPAPIPKKILKHMLAQEGFAPEQLANYFYTAIHRLKTKERITVMMDGSVWRDPHTLEAHSN